MIIPSEGAYAGSVASHGPQASASLGVPDLDQAFVSANGNVRATLDPRNRGDDVILKLAELCDTARGRIPHINAGAKSHSKDITTTPIDQIKVEVIRQIWSVQDFERNFAHGAWSFARAEEKTLTVEADGGEAVEL